MRSMMTLQQLADALGVPISTVRWWRYTQAGPPTFRIGRRVYAYADEVDRWIAAQAAGGTPPAPPPGTPDRSAPRAAATAPEGDDRSAPTKPITEGLSHDQYR